MPSERGVENCTGGRLNVANGPSQWAIRDYSRLFIHALTDDLIVDLIAGKKVGRYSDKLLLYHEI